MIKITPKGVSCGTSHISFRDFISLASVPCDYTCVPKGVKFIKRDKHQALAFYEIPPRTVKINWLGEPLILSFPYVIFSLRMRHRSKWENDENCVVWFRNKPITSMDDELFAPYILNSCSSNMWEDDVFVPFTCIGDFSTCSFSSLERCLGKTCEEVTKAFFTKGFNHEIEENVANSFYNTQKSGMDKRVRDVHDWQKNSIKDPSFVTKIKWKRVRNVKWTVKRVVDIFDWDENGADCHSSILLPFREA